MFKTGLTTITKMMNRNFQIIPFLKQFPFREQSFILIEISLSIKMIKKFLNSYVDSDEIMNDKQVTPSITRINLYSHV